MRVAEILDLESVGIDCEDNDGMTSLHHAAGHGYERIILLLLRRQANIEAEDDRGRTPLICAAEGGQEGSLRVLLRRGAKIEAKDLNGHTAAHHAFVCGFKPVVHTLVQNGADVRSLSLLGKPALVYDRAMTMIDLLIRRRLEDQLVEISKVTILPLRLIPERRPKLCC